MYRSAATYQSSEGIRSRVEYWPSTYSWNPPYANVSRAPGDQQHVINRLGKQHVRSRWEEDQSIRTQDNRVPPKPVEHPKMTSGLFRSPNLPNTYVCILGENGVSPSIACVALAWHAWEIGREEKTEERELGGRWRREGEIEERGEDRGEGARGKMEERGGR